MYCCDGVDFHDLAKMLNEIYRLNILLEALQIKLESA